MYYVINSSRPGEKHPAGCNRHTEGQEGQVMEKRVVQIRSAPVELYKILKFENIVSSGGEAKFVISEGLVRVNGNVEMRKRRKVFPGDTVQIGKTVMEIQLSAD